MDRAIEEARAILLWPDDWDGEGSKSYHEATLDRAAAFLRLGHGRGIPAPRVGAGPDGSVDIWWDLAYAELLVNVPEGAAEGIGYFGDTRSGSSAIKGEIGDEQDAAVMFAWLVAVADKAVRPDQEAG